MARSRLPATTAKAALLLLSLLLPMLLLEGYLRGFAPVAFRAPPEPQPGDAWRELLHVRSPVPGLAYELAPHHQTFATGVAIETNARGMRSYELLSRREGVVRIAVVGDSYTFGFGTPMARTFTAELEVALNEDEEPGRQYEALNYGVGGYSSQDESLVVEHKVLRDDPDLILIAYTLNDPEDAPVQPVHSYYQDVALWQHSHVLRMAAQAWLRWEIRSFGGGSYIRYLHRHPRKWQSVLDAFARVRDLAAERGVPVALVVFPQSYVRDWDDYPFAELHEQVLAAGQAHGFATLDLLSTFQAHDPLQVRLSLSDDHPNARGHQAAARGIKAWLRKGLLPRIDPPEPAHNRAVAPPFL